MGDIIKAGEMNNLGSELYRVYYSIIYHGTQAILSPVADSISDELRGSISRAFREGIQDALDPKVFWELLRKKK